MSPTRRAENRFANFARSRARAGVEFQSGRSLRTPAVDTCADQSYRGGQLKGSIGAESVSLQVVAHRTNIKAEKLASNHNQTTAHAMKIKTSVRSGAITLNHNQTAASGLKIKSGIKSGAIAANHNQTVRGLKVRSGVKAGLNFVKIAY